MEAQEAVPRTDRKQLVEALRRNRKLEDLLVYMINWADLPDEPLDTTARYIRAKADALGLPRRWPDAGI